MKYEFNEIINYKAEQFLTSIGIPFPTRAQLELTELAFSNFCSHQRFASENIQGALSTNSVACRILRTHKLIQQKMAHQPRKFI